MIKRLYILIDRSSSVYKLWPHIGWDYDCNILYYDENEGRKTVYEINVNMAKGCLPDKKLRFLTYIRKDAAEKAANYYNKIFGNTNFEPILIDVDKLDTMYGGKNYDS